MFPPLPPFPPPPRPSPMHQIPQYTRMPPPQAWQSHYAYTKNYGAVPPHRRQPFAPRNVITKAPMPSSKNVSFHASARKIYPVQPPLPEEQENDKENQSPLSSNQEVKPHKATYAQIMRAMTIKLPEPQAIWPMQTTREALPATCEVKKSIWKVTRLDLTSMMLSARREKASSRSLKAVQSRNSRRSNQETHELDLKSDSSSVEGSETDTEDEDFPVLKEFHGLPFLIEFPCDGLDAERNTSSSSVMSDYGEQGVDSQRHDPPVVLDFRKLFTTTQISSHQRYGSVGTVTTASDEGSTPPHMLWRPGDWKCSTCGNHNFSYRDLCKRCREGRYHEAGFVFPLQP